MVMSPAGLGPEKNDRSFLSSERMLRNDYDRKCSVEEKLLVVSLKELVAKTN
jgi:hypothetical protein